MDQEPEDTELNRYFELVEAREDLNTRLAKASPSIAGLYQQAVNNAEQEIIQLEWDPKVRDRLIKLGGGIISALAELDELEPAVRLGLLQNSDIEEKRQAILAEAKDERIKKAVEFLKRVGLITAIQSATESPSNQNEDVTASSDEIKPTEITEPDHAAPESSKIPVKITLRGDTLKVGEGGMMLKTSAVSQESNRHNFSEERLCVLRVLINNQGKMLTINQLWKESFQDKEIDSYTMSKIRDWLLRLTYKKVPVVEFNNKRGRSSAYGIMKHEVELVEETKIDGNQSSDENYSLIETPEADKPAHTNKSTDTHISGGTYEQIIGKFPLSIFESAVLAGFIKVNGDFIKNKGFPMIDDSVVDNLMSEISEQLHPSSEPKPLEEIRRAVIEKVVDFFSNEDLVFEAISEMDARDHRFKLFDYLTLLEGDHRSELLEELLSAQRSFELKVDLRKGGEISEVCTSVVYGNNEVISHSYPLGLALPAYTPRKFVDDPETEAHLRKQLLERENHRIETSSTSAPSGSASLENKDSEVKQPKAIKSRRAIKSPEARDDWETSFRTTIDTAIQSLDEMHLIQEEPQFSRTAYLKSRGGRIGSETSFKRLKSAGLISIDSKSHDNIELYARDIVLMFVYNSNRQHLNKRNPHQARAVQIIEEAVTNFLAEKSKKIANK